MGTEYRALASQTTKPTVTLQMLRSDHFESELGISELGKLPLQTS